MVSSSPSSQAEEYTLIRSVLGGQVELFASLVEAYQPMLNRFFFFQLGDSKLAEELTRDTFLRAYEELGAFQRKASFRAWLIRVANLVFEPFSMSSSSRRKRVLEQTTTDRCGETISALERSIMKLSDNHLRAVIFCSIEKLSYPQVAQILRIPRGTVSSRLAEALFIVRQDMELIA